MDFLPLEIDGKRTYVGFWRRFCSILVDGFLLLPFTFLSLWLGGYNRTLAVVLVIPSAVLFSAYSIYLNARFGGTLGKLAVGIRITKPNGERIGWKEAWLRSSVDLIFAFIMSVLTLWALVLVDPQEYINVGFLQRQNLLASYFPWWHSVASMGKQLWIWSEVVILLLNRRKRALHDFIAGTVVVHKEFVEIASRRSLTNANSLNVGRSRWNTALTAILVGIIVLVGSIILFFSVWMGGLMRTNTDHPPTDTSDLALERPSLPDIENAYTYFSKATNSLVWPTNAPNIADILRENEWDDENDEFLRDLITNNDDTIEIIKEGLNCRICQAPEVTNISDILPPLGAWRHMAQIMALRAMHERVTGQYSQSMQTCADILNFGELIHSDSESLLQYLVGVAILELGLEQCRQVASVSGADDFLLIKLSDQIGRMSTLDQGLTRSLKAEFNMYANLIDDIKEGKFNLDGLVESSEQISGVKRLPSFMFQPNKTKSIMADYFRGLINNASLPCNATKPIDPSDNELHMEGKSMLSLMRSGNMLGKLLGSILLPNLNSIVEKKCRIECSAAATRLILACKAYKMRMNELPDSLESLVTEYINSVPFDPYDGEPFKYSKSKAIVYSVGKDLKDSGGSTELPADETSLSDYDKQWITRDIVFNIEKTSE